MNNLLASFPLVLAAILAVGGAPAWADCSARPLATLPLSGDARPTVPVSINGNPALMVVDTGAEITSVTPDTVAAMGLARDPAHRTLSRTVGGQAVSRNVILEMLSLGGLDYPQRSVAVLSLDGAAVATPPAGLIGADLLDNFDVAFDFPGRRLMLYRPASCGAAGLPWAGPNRKVAATLSDHRQFRFPVLLNDHALTAVFDTGSRGETLSRAAAAAVGVSEAQLQNDPASTGTSGGLHGYVSRLHRFDTFAVGGETFRNVPIDVVDFRQPGTDMLVGVDYMHKRRFFLSYSTATLFIQRPITDAAQAPCLPPAAVLPLLTHTKPVAVSRPRIAVPDPIRARRITGCAGVMFHLTADGLPREVRSVIEEPAGYGLGDLAAREVAGSRYAGSPAGAAWYYEIHRIGPRPAE